MSTAQIDRPFLMNPSLNIVMNLKEFQDYQPNKLLTFANESWLFTFQFDASVSDERTMSNVNEYFESFVNLNIQSRIYASVSSSEGRHRVFEIYRKMSRGNPI